MPSPLRPWHLAQCWRKISLPGESFAEAALEGCQTDRTAVSKAPNASCLKKFTLLTSYQFYQMERWLARFLPIEVQPAKSPDLLQNCGNPYFAFMSNDTILKLELPGIKKLRSGKVRDIFDLGDSLLFVASDRISAFDVIMPNGIPRKGEVLTQISYFWFSQIESFQPNHLISRPGEPLPLALRPFADKLERRSMIVKKAKPLAIECVVRGYLAGSGWKEYREKQSVCGIKLPPGLKDSSELPEPLFTPATKAETGHDENISFEEASRIVGGDIAESARYASMKIYN